MFNYRPGLLSHWKGRDSRESGQKNRIGNKKSRDCDGFSCCFFLMLYSDLTRETRGRVETPAFKAALRLSRLMTLAVCWLAAVWTAGLLVMPSVNPEAVCFLACTQSGSRPPGCRENKRSS